MLSRPFAIGFLPLLLLPLACLLEGIVEHIWARRFRLHSPRFAFRRRSNHSVRNAADEREQAHANPARDVGADIRARFHAAMVIPGRPFEGVIFRMPRVLFLAGGNLVGGFAEGGRCGKIPLRLPVFDLLEEMRIVEPGVLTPRSPRRASR